MWEGRNIVSEGGVIDFVDEDAKEGRSLVVGVWLEAGVDLNDECGGDSREQTSLSS